MIASWLIIDPPFCWLAMLSLLHTLWQGVLLALFVALIMKVTSPSSDREFWQELNRGSYLSTDDSGF